MIRTDEERKELMLKSIKNNYPDIYDFVVLLLNSNYIHFSIIKDEFNTVINLANSDTLKSVTIKCNTINEDSKS